MWVIVGAALAGIAGLGLALKNRAGSARAPTGPLRETAVPPMPRVKDTGITEQECFDRGLDGTTAEFYDCMQKGFVISRKGDKAHSDLAALKARGVKL